MVLTHEEIKKRVGSGLLEAHLHRKIEIDIVSVTLHLDDQFTSYKEYVGEPVTPPKSLPTVTERVGKDGHYILPPAGKILACSDETIRMPLDLLGLVQTKGSLARGFLVVQLCDGQIEPGYTGKITFEIVNMSDFYYKMIPGMPIAQLYLFQLLAPVSQGYAGRYQNAGTPTSMEEPTPIV